MTRWLIIAVAAAALVGMLWYASALDDERRCTERGIAYFKEIGSWPRLSDGREAEAVAKERCERTTSAFPER